jgi:hypothetical protein
MTAYERSLDSDFPQPVAEGLLPPSAEPQESSSEGVGASPTPGKRKAAGKQGKPAGKQKG